MNQELLFIRLLIMIFNPALLDSYVTLHAEELYIYVEGVTNA